MRAKRCRQQGSSHAAGVRPWGLSSSGSPNSGLLWHLRKASCVCAQIPTDMSEAEANRIIRTTLKKDLDHHFRWMWIDLALLILVAPLVVIPGPNVPGFYFTFQVISHFLSYRGARHGLREVEWTISPNSALTELRGLLVDSAPHRMRRVHEVAARLRLQHLASYSNRWRADYADGYIRVVRGYLLPRNPNQSV